MGITIHHKLGLQKVYVKDALDNAERTAEYMKMEATRLKMDFKIRRLSPYSLLIDIDGCETLGFTFKSVDEFLKDHDYLDFDERKKIEQGYQIENFPQNEKYYCYDFCKTQFSKNIIAHKWVADLIKVVASRCCFVEVGDEGDYYHSGKLGDAQEAIKENGLMIAGLMGTFEKMGYQTKK